MSYTYKDFYKTGDTFSITGKFADWIGNPEWLEGYKLLKQNNGNYNNYTPFWKLVSAVSEDVGSELYSKIHHFVRNIRDIDLCETYYLKALSNELGYTQEVPYLTKDYPLEIYKLLNIFSINKDLLFKSPKVMYGLSRDKVYTETGQSVPSGIFDEFDTSTGNFADEQLERLQELSATPSGLLYTDDDEYISLISGTFFDCLSTIVNMNYRPDEVAIENGLITSAIPIWETIGNDLVDDVMFVTYKSYDETIEQRKIELGIRNDFNEKLIYDLLQENKVKLTDYTIPERKILDLEGDRRFELRNKNEPLSRYAQERENKVKEYVKFINLFNTETGGYTDYDVDLNFFELTGTTNYLITTSGSDFVLNEEYITNTAVKLTNIVIRISYLREELKRLVRKHNLTGTELIIRIIVKDLIRKNLYSSNERYLKGGNDLLSMRELEEDNEFDVDVISYYDTTEYLNLSTSNTPTASTDLVNSRYWEITDSELNEITQSQVEDFYKNMVGVEFDTNGTSYSGTSYSDLLSGFLVSVFNTGATSALIDDTTYIETTTAIYTHETDKGYSFYTDELDITTVSAIPVSGLADLGTYDYDADGGSTTHWSLIQGSSISTDATPPGYVKYTPYDGTTTSILNGNCAVFDLETGSSETLSSNTYYLIQSNFYWGSTPDTTSQGVITITNGTGTEKFTHAGGIAGEWYPVNLLVKFTDVSGLKLAIQNNRKHKDYTVFCNKVKIQRVLSEVLLEREEVLSGTPTVQYLPLSSMELSTAVVSSSAIIEERKYTDERKPFLKYSGTVSGYAPYANFKNQVHSTYVPHPYMYGMFEKVSNVDGIETTFNYETETSANAYLSAVIATRIDDYGNLIDSWRKSNTEFMGYQTKYEESTNDNAIGNEDENMAIDGPFNYRALKEFLNDPTTFITNIDTSKYYDNIPDAIDTEFIGQQLSAFQDDIIALSGKTIYKYTYDQYDNHYFLYKDDNDFNTSGSLWVRYNNHPLAIPAISLSGDSNNSYANLDLTEHNSALDFASAIYDIGFSNKIMWMVAHDNLQPKVLFGEIKQTYNNISERNILSFEKDDIHNFEMFEIDTPYKYVGTVSVNDVFNVVKVESDNATGLPTIGSNYKLNIINDIFDPSIYGQYNRTSPSVVVSYNEYINSTENNWRVEKNDEIISIAFESERPDDVVYNFMSNNTRTDYGKTGIETLSAYNSYNTYDNGITIVDFELADEAYGTEIYKRYSTDSIHYFYGHASIGRYGVYKTTPTETKYGYDLFGDYDLTNTLAQSAWSMQYFGGNRGSEYNLFVSEESTYPHTDIVPVSAGPIKGTEDGVYRDLEDFPVTSGTPTSADDINNIGVFELYPDYQFGFWYLNDTNNLPKDRTFYVTSLDDSQVDIKLTKLSPSGSSSFIYGGAVRNIEVHLVNTKKMQFDIFATSPLLTDYDELQFESSATMYSERSNSLATENTSADGTP